MKVGAEFIFSYKTRKNSKKKLVTSYLKMFTFYVPDNTSIISVKNSICFPKSQVQGFFFACLLAFWFVFF